MCRGWIPAPASKEAYTALKRVITAIDIYDHPDEVRLDERRLSQDLGVSRTPIREAMTLLEQEGLVRTRLHHSIVTMREQLLLPDQFPRVQPPLSLFRAE
jgi:DNA-binding GntR family transcriptional regulator